MDDLWICAKCGHDRNPVGRSNCYGCGTLRTSEGGAVEGVGQQPSADPPPSANPPMSLRHCPHCGAALLAAGMRFCGTCGFDFSTLNTPSTPVASNYPAMPTAPPAPWVGAGQVANAGPSPVAPLSASIGPIVAGPQELIVAAGCAAGALIATVLPWYSTVLGSASVSGLQFMFPVIAPVVALIAYWKLHANPPESLTSGRIYALRISLAAGLVIAAWILIAVGSSTTTTSYGYTYNTSSMAQPSVGIWLYGLACAVGAVFSFKIPYTKGVAK